MATKVKLRVRRSIGDLQREYKSGNKKPLEDLMRAWKGIKELPANDPRSFFMIGGFHGEPFRGAGWGSSAYWGGYCNHGNVLFPTWHRMYLIKIEEALQSMPGCKDVMMPYWDETDEDSLKNGIPWALTDESFVLDGKTIPNPLRSFVFTAQITDNVSGDDPNYSKPLGYETVRYPLSGLVGTEADRKATAAHNAKYPNYNDNVKLLNQNIVNWLGSSITVNGQKIPTNVAQKYRDCLNAPNYTVFSNTTSAAEWNENQPKGTKPVVPVESPHNSIHLAVGGYDVPTGPNAGDFSPISGANGDMGENDTAGLDPIFFFHHCNVDRVFWLWQKKHGYTDNLDIIPGYPGTNTVDSQGPTPGMVPNSWLTLESPLNPFTKKSGKKEVVYTSLDCINIEKQFGFTYSPGSLEIDPTVDADVDELPPAGRVIEVSRVNRAPIRGSFLISAFADIGGSKQHIGTEAVLSRWNVQYCANCQTHIEVKAFFELPPMDAATEKKLTANMNSAIEIRIHGRDGQLNADTDGKVLRTDGKAPVKFHVEMK